MSIGKPKNDPIDLNGLMNEIENDHRITVESDAVDKRIDELRAAQKDLRQATEALEKATVTLNEAIAALKSATDNSANIVMKRHFEKQTQAMEAHERKIKKILSRNEGVWVSDFWAKVFCWVILACSLLTLIAYHLKTRL